MLVIEDERSDQVLLVKPIDGPSILASLTRAGLVVDRAGTVLVVDDDLGHLGLMAATLGRLEYSATCERDGAAAVVTAERDPPLAIILDLLMPNMNGFEFLERLREQPRNRDVPIIVWTAKDLTFGEVALLRQRAQAVHTKLNGGMSELLKEIERLVPGARTGHPQV
ncbi:MAG TPA: response regulator [Kofleriaceae bacterium]|nr:response regulator [Kofleriaceae bacterium]